VFTDADLFDSRPSLFPQECNAPDHVHRLNPVGFLTYLLVNRSNINLLVDRARKKVLRGNFFVHRSTPFIEVLDAW